jgi:hypothetical protein
VFYLYSLSATSLPFLLTSRLQVAGSRAEFAG